MGLSAMEYKLSAGVLGGGGVQGLCLNTTIGGGGGGGGGMCVWWMWT